MDIMGESEASVLSNATTGKSPSHFPLGQREKAIFLTVDVLLATSIILGNTLVILSVLRERRLRTPTNAFIASLAVADLMVGVIVIPIDIAFALGYATGVEPLACLACSNVLTSMIILSVLHLTVIAYDRYLAITDPLSYVIKMGRTRISVLIAVAWATAISISAMPLLGWNNLQYFSHEYCDLMFVHAPSYRFFTVSVSVVFPLNLMLFFYFKMFRVAKGHMNRIAAQEATTSRRPTLRRDVKAAKTVAMILGFFLLAWTPASLISVLDFFIKVDHGLQEKLLIYELIFFHIAFTNSMVNPVIYAFRNKEFRHSFLKLTGAVLRCECWKRRVRSAARRAEMTAFPNQASGSVTIVQRAEGNSGVNVAHKTMQIKVESCHSINSITS
ncbi:5-hydroxytryptamine receptor 1A-like [Patiria miniata]|uniref:G-protein coupled receptors family 1 profile domain-containing protein n=1 Tax=Patiria miniata TaxID=46514 RepID=A0A914AV32_PATMI|nr:5-hydroxytryptamine receptor 1A-like [Patiria miniata]